MKKCFFVLIAFVSFTIGWNIGSAESTADDTTMIQSGTQVQVNTEDSPTSPTLTGSVLPRDSNGQTNSPGYPLFRLHAPKYYPPKTARTAILLSATLPGLGQTYSERPARGLAFLAAGVGLIAVGGFNLDRAVTYNDRSNLFNERFYDPYGDGFLTVDQGRVKARGHAQFGVLFLASGIGVYLWNIFDAAKTVDQYNERRFPVQTQQNMQGELPQKSLFITSDGNLSRGEAYLTVNRRF
jgi:hypothetical protein